MRPSGMDSRLTLPRDCSGIKVIMAGAAAIGVLGFFSPGRVIAESPAALDGGLDEIVVTASKRVSTLQDTPISISAVTGSDLQARGVASLATLAQGTPGVSLKSEGPSQTEIEMRGNDLKWRQLRDGRLLSR